MRGVVEYSDANRMLCELSSVQVSCEECGRSTSLGFKELQSATFSGVYSFERLCERLRCKDCPPRPRPWRRLDIKPLWRGMAAQSVA